MILGATENECVGGMLQNGIDGTNTTNNLLDSSVDSTEHKVLFYKVTTRMWLAEKRKRELTLV